MILYLCYVMEMTKHAEKLLLGLFFVRDRKERPRCEKTFRDQKFIPASLLGSHAVEIVTQKSSQFSYTSLGKRKSYLDFPTSLLFV